jgi:hypothetical protein
MYIEEDLSSHCSYLFIYLFSYLLIEYNLRVMAMS